ncbi:MAG: Fic family protein [Elusimicrobiota bacterium]|nr:MAG: Fic family protein [Elusimicrobiota bacterium]
MNTTDFSEKKSGELIRNLHGTWSFVPHPLPPRIEVDWELAATLDRATRALAELAGSGPSLKNANLLIRPFVKREAVYSSRIEGTRSGYEDLVLFEGAEVVQTDDVREIANYVRALDLGIERIQSLPIGARLIGEMHAVLLKDVRGNDKRPGQIRTEQNWIGSRQIETARYVPPPREEMMRGLGDLERYVNTDATLPPLVKIALTHYQFEALHPFLDGNGRIGRILITLMLMSEGLLPSPLLFLSAYFDRTRDEYYDRLLDVSRHGAWKEWTAYFLAGVTEQARDASDRARRLTELREEYMAAVSGPRTSILLHKLIDHLFAQPMVTAGYVKKILAITPASAQKHVDRLVREGILREVTGRQRNRIFSADAVLAIVDPKQ